MLATMAIPLPGHRHGLAAWVALVVPGLARSCRTRQPSSASRSQRHSARRAVRGVLAPAIAMYPSLFAFATNAEELLIAGEYGPQAVRQRDELKLRLARTLDSDRRDPALDQFVVATRGRCRRHAHHDRALWCGRRPISRRTG